jgi:hypothetical protein
MATRRGSRKHKRRDPSRARTRVHNPAGALGLNELVGLGFAFPCGICGHGRRGEAHVRFLPHGLHVWLCQTHGSLAFITRDGGREFARRLQIRWQSNEEFGPRRRLALTAHVERIRRLGGASDKPGSHAWPRLRKEAERRFAAGDDPTTVIRELRLDVSGGPAVAPSLRSFRRWFAEGRWLLPPPPTPTTHPSPPLMPIPQDPVPPVRIHLQRE